MAISTLPKLPKNMKIRAGDTNIPSILAPEQFTTAAASLPLQLDVNTMAAVMVHGIHIVICSPSNKYGVISVTSRSNELSANPKSG